MWIEKNILQAPSDGCIAVRVLENNVQSVIAGACCR
jgi:hypothetical protein